MWLFQNLINLNLQGELMIKNEFKNLLSTPSGESVEYVKRLQKHLDDHNVERAIVPSCNASNDVMRIDFKLTHTKDISHLNREIGVLNREFKVRTKYITDNDNLADKVESKEGSLVVVFRDDKIPRDWKKIVSNSPVQGKGYVVIRSIMDVFDDVVDFAENVSGTYVEIGYETDDDEKIFKLRDKLITLSSECGFVFGARSGGNEYRYPVGKEGVIMIDFEGVKNGN